MGNVHFPKQTLVYHSNVALKQDLDLSDDAFQALHKSFKFHPVLTAKEHRPIGEVNEFRSRFYGWAAQHRQTTVHKGVYRPLDLKFPFKKVSSSVFGINTA